MKTGRIFFIAFMLLATVCTTHGQDTASVTYPYPVAYLPLRIERQPAIMAYMDVKPPKANGHTVLLLHGKNFNGYYWKNVMAVLLSKGFRVIAPDQVGWGKSSFSNIHYSFHLLAANTKKLLDTLGVHKVIIIAHSMGGMLGTRFSLLYPAVVEQLVLEDPIGLEDYRRFVPYRNPDQLFEKERSATYESYKKYQQTYYPVWKPEYEDLVRVQAAALTNPAFQSIAWVNALTTSMIYEQPVCYEWDSLRVPVLFIIGSADRTIVGKDLLSKEVQAAHGHVPELAQQAVRHIAGARLVELPGVGHIPHIQEFSRFMKALEPALPR